MLNPSKSRNYRIISSPIIAGGLIIAPTRVNPLVALKPGGAGDISTTHVAWTFHRGPDVPSPVSDGTYLYLVSEQGVVYCLELKTGALVYGPSRLPHDFYSSSPVLADGKIYVTGESTGVTTVFRAGPEVRDPRVEYVQRPVLAVLPCVAWRSRRGSCSSRRTRTYGWWGRGGSERAASSTDKGSACNSASACSRFTPEPRSCSRETGSTSPTWI